MISQSTAVRFSKSGSLVRKAFPQNRRQSVQKRNQTTVLRAAKLRPAKFEKVFRQVAIGFSGNHCHAVGFPVL
jgi:hypothetical protein